MASPSLSSLPAELISFVIDHLDRLKDLSALARTDRKLYSAVNPVVYKRAVSQGDAWPLAWAAHCGVAGTLRRVLAAGVVPDHQFVDCLPVDDWKRVNAAVRQATTALDDNTVWDTDNECESTIDWSPETEDSDHAGTVTTNQPSSNSNSDPWGWGPVVNDSDRDSDISMDEYVTRRSESVSSTLDDRDRGAVSELGGPGAGIIVRRYNALHLAVQAGHKDIVEILLDHGASINATCECLCECTRLYGLLNAAECPETNATPLSWSALHVAICHSRSDIAKLLLAHGASHIMDPPKDGYESPCLTALHHAAANGLVDVMRYLVDKGIQKDVNVRDAKTLTPLYHAYAERRWDSTMPLLLELGADINVDTKVYLPYSTINPLGEACRMGHFDAADRLLELGADATRGFIVTEIGRGLSPLHLCCMPSARPVRGPATPEDPQQRVYEEEEMGARRMNTIAHLISRGAELDVTDCSGDTPLIAAAQNHNVPALRALIGSGVNIHQRNTVGRTALMQAIMGPQSPVAAIQENPEPLAQSVRVLVAGGARLDERDSEGNTILHLVFKGADTFHSIQKSALRILLNMPSVSDLSQIKNRDNHSPLQLAFQARNLEACEVLVRRGCLRGELDRGELLAMFADALTNPGDQDTLDFVLDLDVNGVLTSDPTLFSALLAKSKYTAIRAARAIAQRGLPPLSPADSTRLLCTAVRMGELFLAYSLLDSGANVNACNDEGEYPLGVFIKHTLLQRRFNRSSSIFQFLQALLDRGANIHLPFASGSSERILNRVIALDLEDVLALMLKKQPLTNDPRANRGFYLHGAVTIKSGQEPCSERIIELLLSAGPCLSEVNDDGDTPLSVLLKSLCKERRFTWRFHRFIKSLAGPDVDINRPNNEGKSVADYLHQLMHPRDTPGHSTFLTRRIQIVDNDQGTKSLRFLPRPSPGLHRHR